MILIAEGLAYWPIGMSWSALISGTGGKERGSAGILDCIVLTAGERM